MDFIVETAYDGTLGTIFLIGLTAFGFIIMYYWGMHNGVRLGANLALQAYIKEWTEIKQRVSGDTWDDLVRAYSVIKDREDRIRGGK